MAKVTYSVTALIICACCPCCGHEESCEDGKVFSSCSGVTSLEAANEAAKSYAVDLAGTGDEIWIRVDSIGPRGGRKTVWQQSVWMLNTFYVNSHP